jgi:tetratricopeptide (TPR) repeat protein
VHRPPHRTVRRLLASAILFAVAGWTAARAASEVLTPEAWDAAVRAAGVDPGEIENPIGFTPEMEEFANRIAGSGTDRERLDRLQQYLFDERHLQFDYENSFTLTARQAWARQGGNCVSFTNLFIALARSIGIPVQAALFHREGNPEMDGDLRIFNTHMAAGYRDGNHIIVFDFFYLRREREFGFHLIDDLSNTGVYLSNRGTAALRGGDTAEALLQLRRAVAIAPDFGSAHGNLGVVRRRTGDLDGALASHLTAQRLEPFDHRVLGNLRRTLSDWTDRFTRENPAWTTEGTTARRVVLGLRELSRGANREACRLLEEAVDIDAGSGSARAAHALCLFVRGKARAARRALAMAERLDWDGREVLRIRQVFTEVESVRTRGRR